jgi:hypothetical protein
MNSTVIAQPRSRSQRPLDEPLRAFGDRGRDLTDALAWPRVLDEVPVDK